MKWYWENDGKANDNGEYIAVVDAEGEGRGAQRFVGKSVQEVADALLVAQANASQKIDEQDRAIKSNIKPVTLAKPAEAPKPLSDAERVSLTAQLGDPKKAPEAVARIVEATSGVPLKRLGENASEDDMESYKRGIIVALDGFTQDVPEFLKSRHNATVLRDYLISKNWDLREKGNYLLAYEALKTTTLLERKPAEPPATPQTPSQEPDRIVRPRATQTSSGLSSQQSTVVIPPRRDSQPKYTKLQIEEMGGDEYKDKYLHETGFRELVDGLYANAPRS